MKPTRRVPALLVILLLVGLMVAGCSSASTPVPSVSPSVGVPSAIGTPASRSPYASSAPSSAALPAVVSPSLAPCPNPEGGACLGPLQPGTYTTVVFQPSITYQVPAGWANYEDTPGNFLLVPPGNDLPGVNAGTSDYIGIYASIVAATPDCQAGPAPGIGTSAEAIATALSKRPGISSTKPRPVTVGGLTGLVLDAHLAPGWTGVCPYSGGSPTVQMITGGATLRARRV